MPFRLSPPCAAPIRGPVLPGLWQGFGPVSVINPLAGSFFLNYGMVRQRTQQSEGA